MRQCRPCVPPPLVSHVAVSANQNNALSFIVSVAASNADSVRVRYQGAQDSSAMTPFYPLSRTTETKIAVVGLHASTTYSLAVEAVSRGGHITSEPTLATTGALPPTIQSLRLAGTGHPSTGLTLVVPLLPDTSNERRWVRRRVR